MGNPQPNPKFKIDLKNFDQQNNKFVGNAYRWKKNRNIL